MKMWLLSLALGLAGVLVVAALAMAGIDLGRAVREGPPWRRRTIGAGLLLLAALGLAPLGGGCEAPGRRAGIVIPTELNDDTRGRIVFRLQVLKQELASARVRPELALPTIEALKTDLDLMAEERTPWRSAGMDADDLERLRTQADELEKRIRRRIDAEATEDVTAQPEWRRIARTWRQAEEIATLQRGPYPFNSAQKERLLKDLGRLGRDTRTLYLHGLLSEAEAGLLQEDAELLERGVTDVRVREDIGATCYMGGPFNVIETLGAEELEKRLALLRKLAAAGRLRPDVVELAIAVTEREIDGLPSEPCPPRIDPVAAPWHVERTRQDAGAILKGVLVRLPPGPAALNQQEPWRRMAAALAETRRMLARKDVRADETTIQWARLADTRHGLTVLHIGGRLTDAESELLRVEYSRYCVELMTMPMIDQARGGDWMAWRSSAAVDRAEERLPLLGPLAADRERHAAAVEEIVRGARADLATLRDPAALAALESDEDRAKAARLANRLEALLAKLSQDGRVP